MKHRMSGNWADDLADSIRWIIGFALMGALLVPVLLVAILILLVLR